MAVLIAACTGGPPPVASRTRNTFDVVIASSGDPTALASARGGTIELTEAKMALGALQWFEGNALFATSVRRDTVQKVADGLLSIATASAHPGHYTPGQSLADLPAVGIVDLLAGPHAAGSADGLTGEYGTLSLPLISSSGLNDASVTLAGTARLNDGDIPFSIALPLDKTVEGIPAAMTIPGAGTVTITVNLEELVRRIDFSALPRDQAIDLLTTAQGRNAVERSVQSQATFTVGYQEW